MKKIFLSLLVLSLAVAVNAQEGHRGHRKMKGDRIGMMKDLNLSDDQKAKMKSINQDFRNQMTELKKNENITVKDFKSKMTTLRKDHKAKMQSVLTAEQKTQIEKMKIERKSKAEGRMKEHADKLKTELGLTADQSTRLEKMRADVRTQMQAIRDNKSLDEAAKKEQMKKLRQDQKTKMESILTAEQNEKMKQLHSERKGKGKGMGRKAGKAEKI